MRRKFFPAWIISMILILVVTLVVSAKSRTSLDSVNNQQSGVFEIFLPILQSVDITPPTVISSIPTNGAVEVDLSSSIVIQFSEAVRSDTITSSTIRVWSASNTTIPSVLNTIHPFIV